MNRLVEVLTDVELLPAIDKKVQTLSGGEQQRLVIARAILNTPQIILADEPTGNLDPDLADEIMDLFFLFNQLDTTVIVATHDYRHLKHPSAGLLALERGKIIQDSYS